MGNLDYTQVLNKIENTRRFGNEPGVVVTAQVIWQTISGVWALRVHIREAFAMDKAICTFL